MAYQIKSGNNVGSSEELSQEEASRKINDWAGKSEIAKNNETFDIISEEQEGNSIENATINDIKNERSNSNNNQQLNDQIFEEERNGRTRSSVDGDFKSTNNDEIKGNSKIREGNNSKKKAQLSTSASSNTDHLSSKNIGHYILGKNIGEGTFGKVKEGKHILTGEKVAIKILEKEKIVDVSDVERVAREIHILKIIRHPHLIQLYEIIETSKQLFLIMEYAEGGELFDYIVARKRLKEKEAAKFFQQIISGVEYIHKLRIVHRDLKPENLLLDKDRNIKLVDFGLSNTYKAGSTLKTACGSPCYAAPEMIAGKRYHGITVDVWSCGVILFAMVCGYLPFEDPNTGCLYKKILSANYQIPSFVTPECRDLIKKILDTDPRTRLTIPEIRDHPWYKQVAPNEKDGIIVGINAIPVNNKVLDLLENLGFNFDINDKSCIDGQFMTNRVSCRMYTKKCIELNKHNHFTTSYYLLLKRFSENNGKINLELNESSTDAILRKTTYPVDYKTAARGVSVPVNNAQPKLDPFAHLTPVARRFIENSEIVTAKAYNSNQNKRINSNANGGDRKGSESPNQIIDPGDNSYSPRRSNFIPSTTTNTKFTTTVIGPFRGKGGYSAPEQKKRDLGYVDIGNGAIFNPRAGTAIEGAEK